MKPEHHRGERGQALVVIALVMVVLMLMVGLAVDVGMAYNERRDLQNAADAAALAGAQQLCDGQGDGAALASANSVGLGNGATQVFPVIYSTEGSLGMRVEVTAQVETFFMRLPPVSMTTVDVSATAAAECSCAAGIGGAWPIAFDIPQWNNLGCMNSNGSIDGGTPHIMVWADDNSNVPELYMADICLPCDCAPFAGFGITSVMSYGGNPMASGHRGWLQLSTPPGFESDPIFGGKQCTGASTLRTWMRYGYPGQIDTGKCVASESGNVQSALQDAHDGGITEAAIVLFEPSLNPDCSSGVVGGCSGSPLLKIAGTGCIKIQQIYYSPGGRVSLYENDPTKKNPGYCTVGTGGNAVSFNNVSGILATKMCDCPYSGSGSGGGTSNLNCVTAVSLVE